MRIVCAARWFAAVTTALTILVIAPVASAAASHVDTRPVSKTGGSKSAATVVKYNGSPMSPEDVARFWTEERRRAAIPDRPQYPNRAPSAYVEQEEAKALVESIPGRLQAAGISPDIHITPVVGKVYYQEVDFSQHECTAATVNSNGKNMVFTAGHCLHQGDGGQFHFINTWSFWGGYHYGAPDRQIFTAAVMVVLNGWANDGDRAYDDGLVILNRNRDGARAIDVLGGNGLRVGGPLEQFHTIIGYPADRNDGRVQYYWQGNSEWSAFFPGNIAFPGNLGEGTSGGPWLLNYYDLPEGGAGYVHGVTSFYGSVTGYSYSPYFIDGAEGQMYRDWANFTT